MNFFSQIATWATHTAWPAIEGFLGGVVHDEVAAATPIVESTVAQLTTEEAAAIASGNTANTGHILASVVNNAKSALVAASINVGTSSLLTAVGAAAAKAPTLVAAKSTS